MVIPVFSSIFPIGSLLIAMFIYYIITGVNYWRSMADETGGKSLGGRRECARSGLIQSDLNEIFLANIVLQVAVIVTHRQFYHPVFFDH